MTNKILWASLAVVAAVALGLSGAFAGEEAPTQEAPKAVKTKAAPETTDAPEATATVKTKTETPICSMLKWISTEIKSVEGAKEGCCSSAFKAWFAGGKDIPLAGMRDQLVADGWTADSTIAFFKKMAAQRGAKDCSDCSSCDKECSGDKTVETSVAGDAASGECSGCDKKGKCCDKDGDCPGCDKAGKCCDKDGDCKGCDKEKESASEDAPAKPAKEGAGS